MFNVGQILFKWTYFLISLAVLDRRLDPVSKGHCILTCLEHVLALEGVRMLSNYLFNLPPNILCHRTNVELQNLVFAILKENFHGIPTIVSAAKQT